MRKQTSIPLTLVLLMFGCACFSMAGFDPELADGTAALQQKCEAFFSGLAASAGTPEAEFARHTAFYAEAWKDLERLEAEARQQPHNEPTLQSLDAIGDNLAELESLHRAGLSRGEIEVIARLFDTQFRMLAALEQAKPREEP